jgi:hypothetical protein
LLDGGCESSDLGIVCNLNFGQVGQISLGDTRTRVFICIGLLKFCDVVRCGMICSESSGTCSGLDVEINMCSFEVWLEVSPCFLSFWFEALVSTDEFHSGSCSNQIVSEGDKLGVSVG